MQASWLSDLCCIARLLSAAHTHDAVSVEAKTMMQESVDAAITVVDDCTASTAVCLLLLLLLCQLMRMTW
jgi:hypothetical protein